MLTKSIFAAAALLAFAVIPAQNAEANSHVNIGVGIGLGAGGFYAPGYYGPADYYQPYYGVSCYQAKKIVRGSGFYNVTATDCSAPSYRFVAWRSGNKFRVRINSAGNITGVSPL
ncbi:hypothetical protein [Aestuariivirga sp.]|uniref:hypothetical protein n=1 Tax=Aestuariivirga sp. TaxID=2650926 RepID=UPI003BA95DF4